MINVPFIRHIWIQMIYSVHFGGLNDNNIIRLQEIRNPFNLKTAISAEKNQHLVMVAVMMNFSVVGCFVNGMTMKIFINF